jgi:hypothetical protein
MTAPRLATISMIAAKRLVVHDCVCAVDLPDGTHLVLDGVPEVLAAATVPERDTTVVAFLDRDAVAWPAGSAVTVFRRG